MTNMAWLQKNVARWHDRKYPDTVLSDLGIKLAEETGEVCKAINRIRERSIRGGADYVNWRENLVEEIGDVAVVLMVLCAHGDLDFAAVIEGRAVEVMSR